MKTFLFSVLLLGISASAMAKEQSFHCGNAPEKKWGQYYVVTGTVKSPTEITDVTYGLAEGSNQAQEEEPVEVFEGLTLKHDPKLAASSKEWKNASAFDLTTKELGPAVLYIRPETFAGKELNADGRAIVRLKVNGKDLRLDCGGFH